ncbi:MAG: iron ABC transporter permease [Gemmatimonadetes bacterium]|nr:MAG: iron ABC transporter permease [Gemmatimonadota bacterium]
MKNFRLEYGIMGSAVVLLLGITAFPMSLVFIQSLFTEYGVFTLDYMHAVFTDPSNFEAFRNTLTIAFLTVIFTILIATPLAWLVVRTDLPFRNTFRTLFLVPYMIPPFIGAIAWGFLLAPRTGYFNQWFMTLFDTKEPLFNIYSYWGIVLVLTFHLFADVFIIVAGALERMDPTLEEAARSSGAGIFRVMREITIPLVSPSIGAGAVLVFITSAANFGIPALIGMEGRVFVLTTRIVYYIEKGGFTGIQEATSLSVLLVLTASIALFINRWYLGKRNYSIIAGKSTTPMQTKLGKFRIPLFLLCSAFVLITVVAPITVIFMISLLKAFGIKFALGNLTLANYEWILFKSAYTKASIFNSFVLASSAATILVLIGSVIAYILVKTNVKGRQFLDFLANLPYSIPGTVVAIAMILAFSGKYGIAIYNTAWILLVAYVVRYMGFAVKALTASLEQVHGSLEEAARISGASWLQTFRTVILPLVRPGIIAAWFLTFMPILRELTMSILLYGPNTRTIGVAIFELQDGGNYCTSAALASLVLMLIIGGKVIINRLSGGKFNI